MNGSPVCPQRKATLPFTQRLVLGKAFEESASHFLTAQGFPIKLNFSREGQWEFGESMAHVEIKYDGEITTYGNLFIETDERRNDDGTSSWRRAGIYDASDPWFLLQGNETSLWLLNVRELRRMDISGKYAHKETPTAKGFVFRKEWAEIIAIRTWSSWK